MSSNNYKIDFAKVLRTNGFLLPTNEEEVTSFESYLKESNVKPKDWDNPLQILKRGKKYDVDFSNPMPDEEAISNLAMAAREGKEITDAIRKKMNEDRRNSNNKQQ